MSILIKGMKMPASCDVCDFAVELNERELGTHLYCGFPGIGVYVDDCVFSVHKDCPLIELPPHGRLIDADELAQAANEFPFGYRGMILAEIAVAPTIIPAEEDGEG